MIRGMGFFRKQVRQARVVFQKPRTLAESPSSAMARHGCFRRVRVFCWPPFGLAPQPIC